MSGFFYVNHPLIGNGVKELYLVVNLVLLVLLFVCMIYDLKDREPTTKKDMTKFVFVTGGVVSSLGKGIASASLAAILESRGLKVTLIKLDPYINVDPGTMSPFQHGEVFVRSC